MDFKGLQLLLFTIVTLFKFLLATNDSTGVCEPNPLEIRPSRIVVKYGDPFTASCTNKDKNVIEIFKWELSQMGALFALINETVNDLMVENATSWEMAPLCSFTTVNGSQCVERLEITLYQPPDSVSISYYNHSGPMDDGGQYVLQCDVKNIAPVRNLTVTFYRGEGVIGTVPPSSDKEKEPVTRSFSLSITARGRKDNGVQYWCEAMLMLGDEGPQPPPVVRSPKLTATVHYKPTIGYARNTVTITEGDSLHLDCSSIGNPPPQYTWSLPPSVNQTSDNATLIIHKVVTSQSGNYTCRATNIQGQDELVFFVDIRVDLLPVFAGLAAAAVLLLLVIGYCIYYTRYRHNHIGHYALTDVFRFRNNSLVAQPNGI